MTGYIDGEFGGVEGDRKVWKGSPVFRELEIGSQLLSPKNWSIVFQREFMF